MMVLTHPQLKKSRIAGENASSDMALSAYTPIGQPSWAHEIWTSEILASVWRELLSAGPSPERYFVVFTGPARFTGDALSVPQIGSTSTSLRGEVLVEEDLPLSPSPIAITRVGITYRHAGIARPILSSGEETSLLQE